MIETLHWHTLHPRYLGKDSKVLDLGANYGQFAQAITARFGCKCLAVEPSPKPFAAIRESSSISKLQAALSAKSGVRPFHIASESVASSLADSRSNGGEIIEVNVFSLADLVNYIAWPRIDLLKVDIEGAEIEMLAACQDDVLGRIAQISIEFHDFCGITPIADVKKTLARLHKLGFFSVRMSRVGHQDTWLINRRILDISTPELLVTKKIIRNWVGFRRVISRRLTVS